MSFAPSRRVAGVVLGGTLVALLLGLPALAQTADNPIVVENRQPGTDAWLIPDPGYQQADDTGNQIKGYASSPSVNKGSTLTFYVTTNPAQSFTIDIYRTGWYAGLGGRLMQHVGPFAGVSQPDCPTVDAATSLIECNWTPSYSLAIPASWTDGVYLAVISSDAKYQNYVPFVVRDDARKAGLVYQQPVNTYQAYNSWGGKSLYTYNSLAAARAYKVSFDRPYADDGSGDYFGWETYLLSWLEQQGYDVTYITDVDADGNAARLRSVKGVIVAGHAEYWSKGMYDAAQSARDAGVSLGFFGSNGVYWQARYEPSTTGVAHRVLVCYKTSDPPNPVDPVTSATPMLTTAQWRETPVNRPEQTLIGVQFTSQTGNTWDDTTTYVAANTANWVYRDSGLVDGSRVAGIAGYEADRQWSQFPQPSSQTATLLSNSDYINVNGLKDTQDASIYQALSGAWVFGSGTESWSWALSRPGFMNDGIQQATANVLNRFLTNVPVPVTPTPLPTPAPSAYRSAVISNAPTGYWRLGESSGTVALDQVGTHPGTYAYAPSLGQPGALFGANSTSVGFNGTSQFLQIPSDSTLNTVAFSVEVWVYPTGGAGAYRGVMASRYYPTGWSLYAGAGNAWEFWVNSGNSMTSVAGGSVALNTWQHLVGTFDGATATLYVNGTLVASSTISVGYQPQTRNPLEVGQSEPGSDLYFPGRLEEAAVYSSALSAAQVQQHYSVGTTGQ